MDKRRVRNFLRLFASIAFFVIYIPHLLVFSVCSNHDLIKDDVAVMKNKMGLYFPFIVCLVYLLHNDRYFRTLFYHRIGPVFSLIIGWYRLGDKYFVISKTTIIGGGAYFAHPFSTEINAKSIGRNFACRHLTTLGNKKDGDNENRPIIGDSVTLGVNVTIVGPVKVGNNVIIGAGSVVVKDVPDNCVVAGNPAKIIRMLE